MEKNTFTLISAKLSFIDKLKFSLKPKKPECKGIVEQAEKIVEEYILNCRLQGITLYKKRKKYAAKKAALIISLVVTAFGIVCFCLKSFL